VTAEQYLPTLPFLKDANRIIEEKLTVRQYNYYSTKEVKGWFFKRKVETFDKTRYLADGSSPYTTCIIHYTGVSFAIYSVHLTGQGDRLQRLYRCLKHEVGTVYITPELYEEFLQIGVDKDERK
jgi:hypothetical protein